MKMKAMSSAKAQFRYVISFRQESRYGYGFGFGVEFFVLCFLDCLGFEFFMPVFRDCLCSSTKKNANEGSLSI